MYVKTAGRVDSSGKHLINVSTILRLSRRAIPAISIDNLIQFTSVGSTDCLGAVYHCRLKHVGSTVQFNAASISGESAESFRYHRSCADRCRLLCG